jgi:primosomal protein N' (replication factor Y)
VAVDVLAVERLFDYLVPDDLAGSVTVGAVVRVSLHGRKVRAWVVADGVEPEAPPERLRPLLGVVSAGPPEDVVELTAWAAHRFAGPRLPLLRAASPPAVVLPARTPAPPPASAAPVDGLDPEAAVLAAGAAGRTLAAVRWPPASDAGDLVAGLLPRRGSCLVVVPDGRLSPLLSRLRVTGRAVVPYLSDGRPSDRAGAWDRARRGSCVVVGGRRTVFAPVPDLAAVVVLDDGSEALKEERSPAWHARDVAVERARRAGARVTLVSPAPPLESVTAAAGVLVPSRGAERSGWPVLEVVDRRREPPGLGLFSTRVVAALRGAVEEGGRAVCVLNRRGRARLLACHACGELARCERCAAAVGEDAGGTRLVCSSCGQARPRLCGRCGGTRLRILRAGVGRVREELAALLPGVDVAMVDAATEKIAGEPVLIGTEAVLHRVEAARVVAFLDFDQELLAPRFRAGEQALWLLVRAARLVGPRPGGGRALVQTRSPRHEVLEAAVRADPGLLLAAEEPRRRLLGLPPYGALGILTGDRSALDAASVALRQAGVGVSTSGRAGLLIRAPTPEVLADAMAEALAAGRTAGRLRAEVDPLRA